MLEIRSEDVERKCHSQLCQKIRVLNARRTACAESYKDDQRVRVRKAIVELRRLADQNARATKSVDTIKAVSISSVRIPARDCVASMRSARSSTTNRSAVV
uniref:(northern house mosquito) hypothetical protein n=1 Tax=Culex pipiens TaxID=7175 RepID=A0A8D8AI94_CULPI